MPIIRHLAAIATLGITVLAFRQLRTEGHPIHLWNRVFADSALLLLCAILVIGPVARFVPAVGRLRPFRRELGFAMFVAAALHVAVYAHGAYGWNVLRFVLADEEHGSGLRQNAAAAANWVGVIALVYALVLTLTSNRAAQRALGRGWKFLQQQAYTLFVLAALHGAGWLYLVYEQSVPFRIWFWLMIGVTIAAQLAGYIRTVVAGKRRAS